MSEPRRASGPGWPSAAVDGAAAAAGEDAEVAAASAVPAGSRQRGVRQYNERVVLEAIRRHGALASADIARRTRLTAQTVSQIARSLEADGLLRKGAPVRGKVGQPAVPLSLNPDGAFSFGVKVGRRSVEMLLVDALGQTRARARRDHRHPSPAPLVAWIAEQRHALVAGLEPAREPGRLQGIGLAAPLDLGGWQTLLGMPDAVARRWRTTDLRAAVQAQVDVPVTLWKDTAAACLAELQVGRGRALPSFLSMFVDTFVGGGLVVEGVLRLGPFGNAGAVGSLAWPLPRRAGRGEAAASPQLLSAASRWTLEQRWQARGLGEPPHDDAALEAPWRAVTRAWLDDEAAPALAHAAHAAACLLDLDGVVLDGAFGPVMREALVDAVARALDACPWEGVRRPVLLAGTLGRDAQALGAAWVPLHAAFAPDRALFVQAQAASPTA